MITAKKANYIAKYDNPQKELVDIATKQLIDYINKITIEESKKGNFQNGITFSANNLTLYHIKLSDKLSARSIKEMVEKVACILEEHGYDIYYEDSYLWWSWQLDNKE